MQVANHPKGADGSAAGSFLIDPPSGTGLTTSFTISPVNWSGNPTNYSIAYTVVGSGSAAILVSDSVRLGAAGTLSVQLPAGLAQFNNLVTVQLWAHAPSGAQSLAPAQANVSVVWPVLSGGAEKAFVNGLANAAKDEAASNPKGAQQMAAGIGSLLNSLSSQPNADTAALSAQRLEMLSVVAGTTGRTITDAAGAIHGAAIGELARQRGS